MRSYNGLYRKLMTDDNIRTAIIQAAKGKNKNRHRHKELKKMASDPDSYIQQARRWITDYQPFTHRAKEINDGINAKKRKIIVPTAKEEIIHHAAVNVLKEIMLPSMYEHSYASIPGRGVHQAVRRIEKWLRTDKRNTKYCLKLDIRKFFDSVDQEVLILKLKRIIRDKRLNELLEKIIHTPESGLPLGFVTSQWFANFILTELDHKIKEDWQAKYYVRFADDMVIFGSNKRKLHRMFENIKNYLEKDLHLQVKDNWQIFRIEARALDFLGFRFYRDHTTLRRKIAIKTHRKAKHINKKGKANIHDARQLVTYAGLTRYVNCYDWFHDRVLRYVNIRQLRKQISWHDKQNKNHKQRSKKI